MIYIATHSEHINWLNYILEEFVRINQASFSCKVIDVTESAVDSDSHMIYYTREYNNQSHWIEDKSDPAISTQVEVKDGFFILGGTSSDHPKCAFGFDIFWNTFVHLSRLEEYQVELSGSSIGSYSFRHPRSDKETFSIPIVNLLFNQLENHLKKEFSHVEFKTSEKAVIELSHDLDYIEKTLQLRLKQSAFNIFNTIKKAGKPIEMMRSFGQSARFLFSNPSYWCFDYWHDIEQKHSRQSTFYVYSKVKVASPVKSWLLDPSYDIATNVRLQDKLKELHDQGWRIGLHGSFFSANDGDLLEKEKTQLENVLNIKVTKVRQHWLRYFEQITPGIHEKLFEFDSTLGWNDRIGFRAGCASQYRPYDHGRQRPYQYFITPQIIMDSNIHDYGKGQETMWEEAGDQLIRGLASLKNVHCAISWHPRTCSNDYRWHHTYEHYLATAEEMKDLSYDK